MSQKEEVMFSKDLETEKQNMFGKKKTKRVSREYITQIAIGSYNLAFEDVLEILELQMYEHGNVADLKDIVSLIEQHRDAVFAEVFGNK